MSANTKIDLLRSIPLFERLRKRDLERVAQLADEVDVPAGRTLLREGEHGSEMFVIATGRVVVERGGSQVAELGPGDWLGEMAILSEGQRVATAKTTEPSHLFVLAHREFHALMDEVPSVRTAVFDCVADRIRKLEPKATY